MYKESIGNATLYLGDCLEITQTIERIDSVITDPPYGMDYCSNHRRAKHKPILNDKNNNLLLWACGIPAVHSKYIFCRWDNLKDVPKPRSLITWVKNNWSMGDLHHEHGRQTEVALFYPEKGHFFPNCRPSDVIYCPRSNNEFHPTEKPVALIRAMLEWTDGIVFDPFMGSGTTGVACAHSNRKFIGIELDQKHFSIACKRIEDAYKRPNFFVNHLSSDQKQEVLEL